MVLPVDKPQLLVKKLHADARLPSRGSAEAAGLDLYSAGDFTIPAGGHAMIPTGIACAIPKGFVGLFRDRSGLASKGITTRANDFKTLKVNLFECDDVGYDLLPLGGVIDSDYRGEWKVILHNLTSESFKITKGDRVAQVVIVPYVSPGVIECHEFPVKEGDLDATERGTGGLGSTGK